MKSIIRRCCVFALFVCLCMTGGRVYSDVLSSNGDYALLTKGSEEDRSLLRKLNELLEKANQDCDVVKKWRQDYVKQERKTYARVVNLFSKFEKSEQKQLAQDLKKGELSEKFRERLDAQNLLINFQRLEAERGYLEKIQGLYNRLSSKILEAESAREIIARRMISDVQEDKLREKEEVVDELSRFLDETQQKLDVWKENDRKQKENLIDSIVKDSRTQRQSKRSQDAQSETEENTIRSSIRGWKKVAGRNDVRQEKEEESSEVQEVEQEEDVAENFEEQNVEQEEDVAENSEEQNVEQEEVGEENSEEQENVQEEVDEKENAEEQQPESEEVDLLEQKNRIDVDLEVKYAEKGIEDSEESQLDSDENDADEKTEEIEQEPQNKSNAVECNWTEIKQTDEPVNNSKQIVRGVDLQLASKPVILATEENTSQRQTISVGNVEFAFRLCSEKDGEFWIQETETTQEQWFAAGVRTTRPCSFKGARLPVENVDWNACVAYVKRLNALNVAPEGWIFTLPTNAQWESAGNAGKNADVSPAEYAWFGENSDKKTHEVGTKAPNASGLYDMSGNVWEWTRSTDSTGRALIVRGASWNDQLQNGALTDRFVCAPKTCGNNLGLRLVLVRKTEVAAPNPAKILR